MAAAYEDLREARDWYDGQSPGLGADFVVAFWSTVEAADRDPAVPRLLEVAGIGENVRRRHFAGTWPFSIVYLVDDDVLIVVAVHHDRRHPRKWRNRIG
ncbi:MAG: type II toxin-antitoxin system RelE/ParE family toxin [Sporichthyaceae bacterium]